MAEDKSELTFITDTVQEMVIVSPGQFVKIHSP
jgi:hypothetical protein